MERDADPFKVPVYEIRPVEVLQTLSCPVQLLSSFSEGSGGGGEVTHQVQSVGRIIFDELHDVPMCHPLRHGGELSFPHVPVNANKFQDVWVG